MKRTGLRALASTASLQNHADGDHIDYQAVDVVVLGQQYSETNHLAITTTPFTKEGHMPLSSRAYRRRLSSHWRMTLVSLAVALFATVALAVEGAATAHAIGPCGTSLLSVPESSTGVLTRALRPGEAVTVEPLTDEIWAGVWFTGGNGPAGWPGTSAPSYYPRPGAPEYSLIGRLEGGFSPGFSYIGDRNLVFLNLANFSRTVRLRVNDNVPGNGSGAFKVRLHHWC